MIIGDGPTPAETDAKVQAVLDQYWPGTTELTAIRRRADHNVYTAMYLEEEVIVKAAPYYQEGWDATVQQANFVNSVGETVSVADYITPYYAKSDSGDGYVTMSRLVPGVCP